MSAPGLAYKRKKDGAWIDTTWEGFGREVRRAAAALSKLGFRKGETGGVLGSTRPEWGVADLAVLHAGGASVGIYPTSTPKQIAYILNDARVGVLFVEKAEDLDRIRKIRPEAPGVRWVVVWDPATALDPKTELSWEAFLAAGDEEDRRDPAGFDARWRVVQPEDPALIIYTSGTTGPPKGVILSHRNIMAIQRSGEEENPIVEGDITVSFLPMAHAAEHVLSFFGRLYHGVATGYAQRIETIIDDAREIRPTYFGSVPRIFEKAHARIQTEVAKQKPWKQKLFWWAIAQGREVSRRVRAKESIPLGLRWKHALADRLVLAKLREVFGGRVKFFVSGAAPIAVEILEFFHACGMLVLEGYGQTECGGLSHINRTDRYKFGTVGQPLPGVECKLAEDGEVLLRSASVFRGYLGKPAETSEALDAEGWLHTGDIGKINPEGFLTLTDRKKNLLKTAGGKFIAPQIIENLVKQADPLLSQVFIHGDRRPFVTALVTLDPMDLPSLAASLGLDGAKPEAIAKDARVVERVRKAIDKANADLARFEQIKKFVVLPRDFTIEAGEVTPTLKIKRKEVEEKYRKELDALYVGEKAE